MPTPCPPGAGGVLVVDMGERVTKVGYAGSPPCALLPTAYEAAGREPEYPISRGEVLDWAVLEAVWRRVFEAVDAEPKSARVFAVVPSVQRGDYLKRLSQMLFEGFGVPYVCFGDSSVLCACACDMKTGVVLDIGSGSSTAAAMLNGRSIESCVITTVVGGRDVTEYLRLLLSQDALSNAPNTLAPTAANYELFEEMKESVCYVDTRPGGLEQATPSRDSGSTTSYAGIPLARGEAWRCTEVLFHPRQLVVDDTQPEKGSVRLLNGLHELVAHVVKKAAAASGIPESAFCSKVALSGGSSRLRGLPDRLTAELLSVLPVGSHIEVHHCLPDKPHLSAWRGGAKLVLGSSLPWRSRIEYLDMRRREEEAGRGNQMAHVEAAHRVADEMKALELDIVQRNLEREREVRHVLEVQLNAAEEREAEIALRERAARVYQKAVQFLQRHDPGCVQTLADLLAHPKYKGNPEKLLDDLDELYLPDPSVYHHGSEGIDMRLFDGRAAGLSASSVLDHLRRRQPRSHVSRQVVVTSRSQGTGMFMRELDPIDAAAGPLCDCVVVSHVEVGSPADIAGVKVGDVVLNVNGVEVVRLKDALDVCHEFYLNFGRKVLETAARVAGKEVPPSALARGGVAALDFLFSTHDPVSRLHAEEFRARHADAYASSVLSDIKAVVAPNRAGLYSLALRGSGDSLPLPGALGDGAGGNPAPGDGADPDKKKKKKKGKGDDDKKSPKKKDKKGDKSPKKGEKSPKKKKKKKDADDA